MDSILRVALYERVSTEEQALRGFSIDAQIANLEEFCEIKGYRIVDHYTDAGVSGGKAALQRPEMARLMEDVKAGKIDMILFTKLDRWFRNIKEYFKVQEILEQNRVEWKAIHEDYDTTTANGRMAITIFLAIAQNEREKGSERINAVLENKRKKKEACFGGRYKPAGYKKVKDENGITRLVIDPETEPLIRDFWRLIKNGYSVNAAAKVINKEYGITRSYSAWTGIYRNELYRGKYRGIENFCPAYIEQEEWERTCSTKKIKTPAHNRIYLFAGLMRCPICGHSLTSVSKAYANGHEFYYYVCRYKTQGLCTNGRYVAETVTEKWLLANIKDRLKAYIYDAEIAAAAPKPKPKRDKEKINEKIRRLNVVYMGGGKSDEEYMTELAELKAQLAAAEKEAAGISKENNLDSLRAFLNTDLEGIYNTLTREEKRTLWRSIIERLIIEGNRVVDVEFRK